MQKRPHQRDAAPVRCRCRTNPGRTVSCSGHGLMFSDCLHHLIDNEPLIGVIGIAVPNVIRLPEFVIRAVEALP